MRNAKRYAAVGQREIDEAIEAALAERDAVWAAYLAERSRTCCGCAICCCQWCEDILRSSRVAEAREARLAREHGVLFERSRERFLARVRGLCVVCGHSSPEAILCTPCGERMFNRCYYGCGGVPTVPGGICEDCLPWADQVDPVMRSDAFSC